MTIFYLAVLLGLAYFAILPRPESHFRTVAKTLPIILLCVFAALSGAWWLVVVALGLSAVGDALISRSDRAQSAARLLDEANRIRYAQVSFETRGDPLHVEAVEQSVARIVELVSDAAKRKRAE